MQHILDSPAAVRSFQAGFAEGVWNGAKSLVGGAISLAELGAGFGPVGMLNDAANWAAGEVGIRLPDGGPSFNASFRTIEAAGRGIAAYVGDVANGHAHIGSDIKGWIGAHWNELKADHARAAAAGPDAEAQWWGQVAGRATFELAAFAVPATKFATVAKAGEALQLGLRAGRLGETIAEASRVGKLGELFGAAMKSGNVAELVAEARKAGQLPALLAEARKTTGGVEAIERSGGLSAAELASIRSAAPAEGAAGGTIRNVNPGFPTSGRMQNCANCAIATDATLAGRPASALLSNGPVKLPDLARVLGGTFRPDTTIEPIRSEMLASGPGARGVVFGNRGPGRIGHFFNVVNQNGVVRFLDGQSSAAAKLEGEGYKSSRLLRTN